MDDYDFDLTTDLSGKPAPRPLTMEDLQSAFETIRRGPTPEEYAAEVESRRRAHAIVEELIASGVITREEAVDYLLTAYLLGA